MSVHVNQIKNSRVSNNINVNDLSSTRHFHDTGGEVQGSKGDASQRRASWEASSKQPKFSKDHPQFQMRCRCIVKGLSNVFRVHIYIDLI
jgi:hypothetical protein